MTAQTDDGGTVAERLEAVYAALTAEDADADPVRLAGAALEALEADADSFSDQFVRADQADGPPLDRDTRESLSEFTLAGRISVVYRPLIYNLLEAYVTEPEFVDQQLLIRQLERVIDTESRLAEARDGVESDIERAEAAYRGDSGDFVDSTVGRPVRNPHEPNLDLRQSASVSTQYRVGERGAIAYEVTNAGGETEDAFRFAVEPSRERAFEVGVLDGEAYDRGVERSARDDEGSDASAFPAPADSPRSLDVGRVSANHRETVAVVFEAVESGHDAVTVSLERVDGGSGDDGSTGNGSADGGSTSTGNGSADGDGEGATSADEERRIEATDRRDVLSLRARTDGEIDARRAAIEDHTIVGLDTGAETETSSDDGEGGDDDDGLPLDFVTGGVGVAALGYGSYRWLRSRDGDADGVGDGE